jgi:hypothetical protein
MAVYAADLDGDTDLDVLSASFMDDTVAWYESDGGTPPSFAAHTITTGAWGVVSGLRAGNQVILSDMTPWIDHERVRLR